MCRFPMGPCPDGQAFGCKLPKAPDAYHIAGVVIPDTGSEAKARVEDPIATLTG
jgi:hypothetical protein